ncbi:receptor-like protein 33 [Humulus lupulus]|uniref:receptor-like protein 33 n=1 Tax=Humulus lupulus TaxID=3486 RepID=UPI002B405477|nr:receptor-like protein 33 [Humulus lupulus]
MRMLLYYLVFFFLLIHSQLFISSSSSSPDHAPQCHPHESSALLQLKTSFKYPAPGTAFHAIDTWNNENCCTWDGITCDNVIGHVIGLDLFAWSLQGTISSNSTLFKLHHLQTLQLSDNDFRESFIVPEFGKFKNMTSLDLRYSNFSGHVPLEISHLSKLDYLALGGGYKVMIGENTFKALSQNLSNLTSFYLVSIDLSSLSLVISVKNFPSLMYIDLDNCKLSRKLLESIFELSNLTGLSLEDNEAPNVSLPTSNWSSALNSLTLRHNTFSIDLPLLLKDIPKSLSSLQLSFSNLVGPLPDNIQFYDSSNHLVHSAPNFTDLILSNNLLNGTIPTWIYALPYLEYLDLSDNQFTGEIIRDFETTSFGETVFLGITPRSTLQSQNLRHLDLSSNKFSGTLELEKLLISKRLAYLDLSSNNISVTFGNTKNYSLDNLEELYLSSCNITEFPHILKSSKILSTLDLSHNQIQGSAPKWLWEVGKNSLYNLTLSHNFLTYIEPLPWNRLLYLDLSSNSFSGPLPIIASYFLSFISVAKNQFVGEILTSFCNMSFLEVLDLSSNNLSGIIPRCIVKHGKRLSVLNFSRNKLYGTIPNTFLVGSTLRNLNLNGNHLEGSLPRSLEYCKNLEVLDLGNNILNDSFPHWLDSLPALRVLVLRSNRFYGSIGKPKIKYPFPELRIIDLSHNEFDGALPTKYFVNFKAMILNTKNVELKYMGEDYYQDSITVTMKGYELELVHILTIFVTLDFSYNNFSGEIPVFLGGLNALKGLNISHNMLRGTIPSSLGNLTNLEWLDLSANKLSGNIPWQLTDLIWLQILNLSENKLVGPIPNGKQFNTFSNDSFKGNLDLCGFPLSKPCNEEYEGSTMEQENESEDANGFTWKVVLLGNNNDTLPNILSELHLSSCGISEFPYSLRSLENLRYLDLSNNQIEGSVPQWLWNMGKDSLLQILDLSNNNLSENIPPCLGNSSLRVLDLHKNKLHGLIPSHFAKGNCLGVLNLKENQLEGSLPKSLLNCKELKFLDIGINKINGAFPWWLESLPNLQVLILRSNRFQGPIGNPKLRHPFHNLRIMDLSGNEFTDHLPQKYFKNFVGMMNATSDYLRYMEYPTLIRYYESSSLTIKGYYPELEKIQTMLIFIDFSRNNFTGEIPELLGKLNSLKGLNFSHNKISCNIPPSLGNLTNLEWLDLSSNELVGKIPWQLAANLNQLQILNLSVNQLEGLIPRSRQFDTFTNDSYKENLGLCGFPISESCNEDTIHQFQQEDNEEHVKGFDWKIVLIGFGSGMVIGISIGYMFLTDQNIDGIVKTLKGEQWHLMAKRSKQRRARQNVGIERRH